MPSIEELRKRGSTNVTRRYCAKCRSVALTYRKSRVCRVCGEPLEITKATQGSWGDFNYRPEITGDPPVVL